MLDRRSFLSITALSGLAAACTPLRADEWDSQLIVLRHMDRDPGNPVINNLGRRRALALAPALSDLQVDAIFAPDLERNILSTAPFAESRGVDPTYIDTSRNVTEFLTMQAEGRSIVWIGNTTNLDEIWVDLALPGDPPKIYGRIAVLRRVGNRRWFLAEERRFGP